jgi:hypothetical protein
MAWNLGCRVVRLHPARVGEPQTSRLGVRHFLGPLYCLRDTHALSVQCLRSLPHSPVSQQTDGLQLQLSRIQWREIVAFVGFCTFVGEVGALGERNAVQYSQVSARS